MAPGTFGWRLMPSTKVASFPAQWERDHHVGPPWRQRVAPQPITTLQAGHAWVWGDIEKWFRAMGRTFKPQPTFRGGMPQPRAG